ncbi:hypothetical protein [Deinococcus radiopugnans]|uniref:hypothetical protein n=1 Tax=Deinococcus radiopugnans TaxID=57497 RepID=UPI0012E08ACE|nr:hypothetical protein [Deinococcus radiopugnans]
MTKIGIAEHALALAWAIDLGFPAAEQLLEEWATRNLLEPDAPLVELSEALGSFPQERRQALMRLAHHATPYGAVRLLLANFSRGLEIDSSVRCLSVFYTLERFIRASDDAGPLPRLPLSRERTEGIFKTYGYGRDDWEASGEGEPIRESEACDAIVHLLKALKPERAAEIIQGASQCHP